MIALVTVTPSNQNVTEHLGSIMTPAQLHFARTDVGD